VLSVPIHQPARNPGPLLAGTPPPQALPPSEALTHDWNKYRDQIVATAGVDRVVRTFDLRNPSGGPLAVLPGHGYAVRKVAWSPHLSDVLLSASYDMTVRVWSDGSAMGAQQGPGGVGGSVGMGMGREMGRMERHTEFAVGVDWCMFGAEGWCASCGWDEKVLVWDVRGVMGR
jgi:peroxin-7